MFRIDTADLRLDRAERLDNGWLVVPASIGRVGMLRYRNADGSTRTEYRSAADVAASASSFDGVPLTDGHPVEGRLDATNTRRHQVGTVYQARYDAKSETVEAMIRITDKVVADEVEAGRVQLSPGYTVDAKPGPHPDGTRCDFYQTAIVGNHVANVDRGRQGPQISIRLDVDTLAADEFELATPEEPMKKITIDGVDYDVHEVVAARFDALQADQAKAQARIDALDAQQADHAKAQAHQDATFNERVAKRVELITSAGRVLGGALRSDASDTEIMTDVVLRVDGEDAKAAIEAKAEYPGYLLARYELAIERHDAASKKPTISEAAAAATRSDSLAVPPQVEARRHREEKLANGWRGDDHKSGSDDLIAAIHKLANRGA